MATIIFDFDGTLADSFPYVADFLLEQAGVELGDGQRDRLRGMSMPAMARTLGFAWWRMPNLFLQGRHRMQRQLKNVQPIVGMPELIRKLHNEGHELFVLSTNTVRNVRGFLQHYDLQQYFLQIYGGVGLFGKAPALRRLLREQKLDKTSAVYVGDELRDVEAAQAIKLKVIAVTWGFARTSDLGDLKPTGLADSPEQLLSLLEEI